MVGLLITGHGHFATGLGSSLRLITGNTENIEYVDFEADHSTQTLAHNLAGGSPFKTAVECKFARADQKIEVIAGSNLPMLIEGSMSMGIYENPLEMAEALIPTGKDYIIRFELAEHNDDTEEDGIYV